MLALAAGAAHAQGRFVHLRNDARVIESERDGVVQLQCERMPGPDFSPQRWARDCNELARVVLKSLVRDKRLVDRKVPSKPYGDEDDPGQVLSLERALVGGDGGSK